MEKVKHLDQNKGACWNRLPGGSAEIKINGLPVRNLNAQTTGWVHFLRFARYGYETREAIDFVKEKKIVFTGKKIECPSV